MYYEHNGLLMRNSSIQAPELIQLLPATTILSTFFTLISLANYTVHHCWQVLGIRCRFMSVLGSWISGLEVEIFAGMKYIMISATVNSCLHLPPANWMGQYSVKAQFLWVELSPTLWIWRGKFLSVHLVHCPSHNSWHCHEQWTI
jgi:hypothetical protein